MQEASFTDFEHLATMLQHCDCVVANAGTILLDSLVNDRPDTAKELADKWTEWAKRVGVRDFDRLGKLEVSSP